MSTGRVWLITGVNSGLGLALAAHVAAQGDQIIGSVRSLSKFPETLREAGVKPLVVNLSGTDEEIRASAESALKIFGRVDVLVNNAGFGVFGAVEELKISDIRAGFQTNVFGLLAFSQPIIEHLRTRRTGHILNLSSVVSTMSSPSWSTYCASKAALEAFSDSLHQELKLFGVRVLILVPGFFPSSFFDNLPNHASSTAPPSDSLVQESKIYTDVTQGYDSARGIGRIHAEKEQIGDPAKYAARVYEVVTGTGLAEQSGVVARVGADGSWEGPWEMNRVPVGRDCGEMLEKRLEVLRENVKLFKPVTDSTDVEKERLKYFIQI